MIVSDKLPPKIFVIESDEVENTALCNAIERYWFEVIRAKTTESALRIAELYVPHVAIISSKIYGKAAIELGANLQKIPGLQGLPLIFLIDQQEDSNDYNPYNNPCIEILHRPFTPNELMTAIKALLRKSSPVFQDKVLTYSDIKIDLATFKVRRGIKQIHLGPTEFKILQLFIQKPKNIYSRRQIIDYVWGADKEIAQRTIDVHINRLRTLMKLDTDRYPIIKTIRSAGYCLD